MAGCGEMSGWESRATHKKILSTFPPRNRRSWPPYESAPFQCQDRLAGAQSKPHAILADNVGNYYRRRRRDRHGGSWRGRHDEDTAADPEYREQSDYGSSGQHQRERRAPLVRGAWRLRLRTMPRRSRRNAPRFRRLLPWFAAEFRSFSEAATGPPRHKGSLRI